MLHTAEITDDRRLAELAPEWDDLLGRCSHSTVFQTWEWLGMCRRYFGRGKRLAALAIQDGDRLVGLAPFEITRIYGSPLRRLQFLGTGRSDYLSIIADDSAQPEVLQEVFGWIHKIRSRWDVVDLQAIPEGSPTLGFIANTECRRDFASVNDDANPDTAYPQCGRDLASVNDDANPGTTYPQRRRDFASVNDDANPDIGVSDPRGSQNSSYVGFGVTGHKPPGELLLQVMDQELCPYMPLSATWEETIAPLGKKTRYNLGYYERLMRREFDVEIGMVDPNQLDEGLDALFRLHSARWRKRGLPGVLSGDHTRRFHRELAELFMERGWLRLHTIRLNGEIRAALYCLAFGSSTSYYIGGFAPELCRYSIGTVLTGHAIRRAVEDGCSEFDFLRGNEGYKARWTDRARMNGRIVICGGGIRSAASSAVCRLEMKIEHSAKEWMHRRFGGLPVHRKR